MSEEDYLEVDVPSGKAWVLSKRVNDVKKIDAIFFDCDGVLIDVRNSYDTAIEKTVNFLAKNLMDVNLPKSLPLQRVILELKRNGGFNNDWSISYVILLAIYIYIVDNEDGTIIEEMSKNQREQFLLEKIQLRKSKKTLSIPFEESCWQKTVEAIVQLSRRADSSGIVSIERLLLNEGYEKSVNACKRLLGYPVESSIVGRVFDEIFYGIELFQKKFKTEPKFYSGNGLVEMERPVITEKTLTSLINYVGRKKIGIISGRDYISGAKTLGYLIKNFEPINLRFLLVDPNHNSDGKSSEPLLNKPNPEILIRAINDIDPIECCLYIGDSAEDLIMVQYANKISPKFAFAGVYNVVNFKDEMCSYFFEKEADMILPSVNDLPDLINMFGELKK